MEIISKHIASLAESQTLAMARRVNLMRQQGVDIVSMTLGEPDFDTPMHIKQAAQQAIADNYSHYGPANGILSLREAISKQMLGYTPDEIIVSVGAKQSICNAVMALVDEGDEVIIPTPCWVSYSEMVKIVGGTNVFVKTTAAAEYKITAAQLKEGITERTKLLILCSPNNPTGSVYTKEEIAGLIEVLKEHPNIYVISDEVYDAIVFDAQDKLGNELLSELGDRVVRVNGVSKRYAMTGYRIGWMVCHNKEILKACSILQGQYLTCACMVAQKAAEAALAGSQECVGAMRKEYAKRRELIMLLLNEIPDIHCVIPAGAFYVFPDVSKYYGKRFGDKTITNSDDMVNYLLVEAHVACVAGSAYGEDTCIRLSFATNEANIREALKRIKTALLKLQ